MFLGANFAKDFSTHQVAPDGARMLGKQYIFFKIAFLFAVLWEVSDSQHVVPAPGCPRWPRYLRMVPDDSRCPQMTTWS